MDDSHFGTLISKLAERKIVPESKVTIPLLFSDGKNSDHQNSDQLKSISETKNCGSQFLGS